MNPIEETKIKASNGKVKPLPSAEWLNAAFDISPEVQGIVWKGNKKGAGSKCKRPNGLKRDVCVGIKQDGKTKLYPVHQIVWKMLGREIPDGHELHHIDGDLWNNSVDNLECIPTHQKALKSRPIKNKASGLPRGIAIDKTCYVAWITFNRKPVRLGYFTQVDDAIRARDEAEAKVLAGIDPTPIKIAPAAKEAKITKPKPIRDIPSIEFLREALRYEPDTGKFYWRSDRPRHHFNSDRGMNISNSVYGGTEAGQTRPDGYVMICINGVRYYAHRVAWMFVHGVDPEGLQVDHFNRIRNDNRIDNLRLVTNQHNSFNAGARSTKGSDLPRGIQKHLNGKYEATLKHNDKNYWLGTFDSIELAQEARRNKALELGITTFLE